jgi:hypothetical protein
MMEDDFEKTVSSVESVDQNKLTSDVLLTRFEGSKRILTNYTEYLVMPELSESEQIMKELGVLNVPRDKDGNKVFNK